MRHCLSQKEKEKEIQKGGITVLLQKLIKNSPCAAATVARLASVWGEPWKVVPLPQGRLAAKWDRPPAAGGYWGMFRVVVISGDGTVLDWNA